MLRQRLVALAVLLFPVLAHAVPREPRNLFLLLLPASTGLSEAALNTSPISTPIDVSGYSALSIQIVHTRGAATTMSVSCTHSLDGVNYDALKKIDFPTSTSGAGNTYDLSLTEPVSASGVVIFPPITINTKWLKCQYSGASANGSDLISVTYGLGVL